MAGAFISLAAVRAFADCDVDAPNLHLSLADLPEPERETYFGLPKAQIDPGRCTGCGLCRDHCRFDAVLWEGGTFRVDPFACEGCAVCTVVCPVDAVSMLPSANGEMRLFAGGGRVFSTGSLHMGSGNTGKLVAQVKKRLLDRAPETQLAVIDGSPGIGCPVIASLSGVDMVLVVAEPSLSGLSDLGRIVRTARQFRVKIAVCVNKWDISPRHTEMIKAYCVEEGLPFAGLIPYDPAAVEAVNEGLTVAQMDCPSGRAIQDIFEKVAGLLFPGKERHDAAIHGAG